MPSSDSGLVRIPGPSALPIVGNIFDIDASAGLQSLLRMAGEYGPIFQLTIAGQRQIFVNNVELANEVCDESRFCKVVNGGLEKLRSAVHDGLFTAHEGEHNWDLAHRILMPVFGPTKVREMAGPMNDIAQQLCLKWARYGPSYPIEVANDFTRLTLDTLALCAMGYRFNSFYRESSMHPFVISMSRFLKDSDEQSQLPELFSNLWIQAKMRNKEDIKVMRDLSQEIVEQRRQYPGEADDLLNNLLHKTDPKTGERMSDSSIIDNMITFLVAGHETTSGLLSFTFYHLLKNPWAMEKAQKEVDDVIGTEKVTVKHLPQLKYINAILRETLRLAPTAPAFTVGALKNDVIGGKYAVKKGEAINILLLASHCDKAVYGPDENEWKPERMLDENFNKLPPNAWKPFGNGKRGCIGRAFAWQESLLVIATLLQTFTFTLDNPSYQLRVKESLTIKPDGLRMRAALRRHQTPTELVPGLTPSQESAHKGLKPGISKQPAGGKGTGQGNNKPLAIFYGSNSGSCESLANILASDAAKHGYAIQTIDTLDSARESLPSNQPVLIVTATYDGKPPDNATEFVNWLKSLTGKPLNSVSYAVFGCGHHDWATTFYKVPTLIDELLEQRGARRIASRGAANAATSDLFSDLEKWEEDVLWPAFGIAPGLLESQGLVEPGIKISFQRPYIQRQEFSEAIVASSSELTSSASFGRKCHVKLLLPQDMAYTAGDYLAVLALNPISNVQRALSRFHLAWDSILIIESTGPTQLPTAAPVSVADLFGAYVELSQPATPRNIRVLAATASDEQTKQALLKLANETFATEVRDKRLSVLDLLERYDSVRLPVEAFLEMLPPLRPRTYSISSAPQWNPSHVTLTWSIVDAPSWSGHGRFLGVASNHLSDLAPGAVVRVTVRRSNPAFHLPVDPESYPIVMIASGSGLAPFRGFIQERALQLRAGKSLAPALLFFGCRGPHDDLYRAELDGFEDSGVVHVMRAYSKATIEPDAGGCAYVQDRVWAERKDVADFWNRGASIFVCGGTRMSEAVKDTFIKIAYVDAKHNDGKSPREWFDSLEPRRYVAEVFN
ncbi:cytochrome P450 [Zopfia rhizophila CBS 207.26]|uniref:Bifunctional cytochrome P450/NADPH--P450 reductase n=1 Tax=Zopfia rhizophila CBS 207.26 TaxID=1314779 RepID=A0A6A6DMH1_9PEZI|nr:cytochrome P450 [Zopfia rhizophila CBS 207.26]